MGRRRGEEKEPLLQLHIQKKKKKKKTTGSISINHTPQQFALLGLVVTSRHFQMHAEPSYIPMLRPRDTQ